MITGIHHVSMKCDSMDDFLKEKSFYCDLLGLAVKREWNEGIMIDTGNGLIEIFHNGTGTRSIGAVRHFALASDNVDEDIVKIRNAGYEVFIEPKDIVIQSDPPFPARIAFCRGPLNEEIELFQEKQNDL